MILDPDWVTKLPHQTKTFKPKFLKYCKDHPNKKVMLAQDMRDVITLTAKYYNYNPSDIVTHAQYVNLTKTAMCKPGACIWQGKTRTGATVLLTNDWFDTNIEYGKSQWYCTTIQMDKINIECMHGDWYELPVGDSISVDATSTALPCAVVTRCISPRKQNVRFTTPLKPKYNIKTPPYKKNKTMLIT